MQGSSRAAGVLGRAKNPEVTRALLVECAFQEIYEHGYAGASLDRILSKTGLTKGALYHHFESKADLTHAVIDDVVRGWVVDWVAPLEVSDDPVSTLIETARRIMGSRTPSQLECGCPLNNLSQELSNSDEAFRLHLAQLFDEWRLGIAAGLRRGQVLGKVRADIDPTATGAFIVSAIEGLAGTAKSSRDHKLVLSAGGVLLEFISALRPTVDQTGRRIEALHAVVPDRHIP